MSPTGKLNVWNIFKKLDSKNTKIFLSYSKKYFWIEYRVIAKWLILFTVYCLIILKSVCPNSFKTIDRSLVTFFLLNFFKGTVFSYSWNYKHKEKFIQDFIELRSSIQGDNAPTNLKNSNFTDAIKGTAPTTNSISPFFWILQIIAYEDTTILGLVWLRQLPIPIIKVPVGLIRPKENVLTVWIFCTYPSILCFSKTST